MTDVLEGPDGTTQHKTGLRALLVLPPLALVLASLVLLVVSPFAWGAGSSVGFPAWMPPVGGLLIASGAFVVGWYSLIKTVRATRGDFEVFGLHLVFGVLVFVSGSLSLAWIAQRLPSSVTYSTMVDEGESIETPGIFFALSLIYAALNIAWVWVGAYLYSHAVSNQAPNRLSQRRPDEVDGVGELLRERR